MRARTCPVCGRSIRKATPWSTPERFSKSFSPGIRVGWGILPPALLGTRAGRKRERRFRLAALQPGLDGDGARTGALRAAARSAAGGLPREDRDLPPRGRRVLGPDRRHRLGASQRRPLRLAALAGKRRHGAGRPLVRPGLGRRRAVRARRVLLSGRGASRGRGTCCG